jgi:hypothetical protein
VMAIPTQCMNPQLLGQTVDDGYWANGFQFTYTYMVTPSFSDKSPKLMFRTPLATAS